MTNVQNDSVEIDKLQARVARKAAIKRVSDSVEAAAIITERIAKAYQTKYKKTAKAKWAERLHNIVSTSEIETGNHIGSVLIDHERRNAKNQVMSVYWATSEDGHLIAKLPFYGKKEEDHHSYRPILVSDHALERVIERTRELRVPSILNELAPAIFGIALILTVASDHLEAPPRSDEQFAVPSPNGIAIVVISTEKDEWSAVIKTWLSFDLVKTNFRLKSLYNGTYERLDRKHEQRRGPYRVIFKVSCVNKPVLAPRRIDEGDYAWRQLKAPSDDDASGTIAIT